MSNGKTVITGRGGLKGLEFDTSKAEKVVQAEAGPYFFVNFS